SQTKLILAAIRQSDFLNRLDADETSMMVDGLSQREQQKGEYIITEGSEGNTMYIVAEGSLLVSQANRLLRKLQKGDVFGELAILYNCKRTATVTAMTDVKLWCIERQTYRAIMTSKSKRKREQIMGFLKGAKTMKGLSDAQLSKIIDCMEECKFQPNKAIVQEGDEGKTFYIILRGEVRVTKTISGQQRQIRLLGEGDHFGELALIRKIRRTATCMAVGEVTCISIDKETYNFSKHVGQVSSITKPQSVQCNNAEKDIGNRKLSQRWASCWVRTSAGCIQFRTSLEELVPVLYKEGRYSGEPVTLGVGGFGRVELVSDAMTGEYFALKKISKKHVVQMRQQEHISVEKRILQSLDCNFIVRLHTSFRDSRFVYMLLELCVGGELWTKLREVRRFDEVVSVFCSACVVEAFDYLHKHWIVYRDLKPENLMLDRHGYIKLVDFGFAKQLVKGEKTYSFCGTPEYLAPELLRNEGHDCAADYWSLGILVYELLVGSPPFSSSDPQRLYSRILDGVIKYPAHMSDAARSIVNKLCRQRPGQRLGNTKNGIKDIRNHRWFSEINWRKLALGQIEAPTARFELQGPLYANFDRFSPDKSNVEEEFSGWDEDF
uniref:Protein kinase cGMP-dependent 3 n=1 Tax=Latimeria chalumnae TaxID=7897 RepID=H3AQF9_LATCH